MRESEAIQIVIEYEKKKGRKAKDVRKKKKGYDVDSENRLIEVKLRNFPKRRFVFLTEREFQTFLKNKNAWLYIVTKDGEVYEIERDLVLQNATFRPRWKVSLRKDVVGV